MLDSLEIVDKDNIQVSWYDNGNHWVTWDSGELFSHLVDQYDEIERLNNIIKEAIEYIQDRYDGEVLTHTFDKDNVKELLEILDKVDKGE